MNQDKAVQFVRENGDEIAQARLRYLLHGERPSPPIIQQLFNGQREDGGFAPFWAPDYSSIDATCYRLAQAEQLGLDKSETAVADVLRFLLWRQGEDGRFGEDPTVAGSAPPWAQPGDLAAELYLTANAGFWLAFYGHEEPAQKAADFLAQHLEEETNKLPSFTQTQWLAGSLWWMVGMANEAESVLHQHLFIHLPQSAGELAWMLNAALAAKWPSDRSIMIAGALKLNGLQAEDGRFPSDDGQDVHTTLEALRALTQLQQENGNE